MKENNGENLSVIQNERQQVHVKDESPNGEKKKQTDAVERSVLN